MLAYRRDGAWVEWHGEPMPMAGEGSYNLPAGAEALYSDADLTKYGLHRVTVDPVPAGHRLTGQQLVDDAGAPRLAPVSAPIPLADLKAARLAEAADKRWQVETSGIMVGGVPIATDDRSKLMLTGARVKAAADPDFVTQWVAADGSINSMTAAEIIAISDAVLAHVDACFARFATLSAAIDAAEDEAALAAIDVGAGWPG